MLTPLLHRKTEPEIPIVDLVACMQGRTRHRSRNLKSRIANDLPVFDGVGHSPGK